MYRESHTFDRPLSGNIVVQQILALPALEQPPLRIRVPVMPRNGTLLGFDKATGRPLGVITEDLSDLRHPAHVQLLGQVRPLLRARFAHKPAMLSAESDSIEMTKMCL